jgi:hypothetical protein
MAHNAEIARLLDDLSAALDDDVDLRAGFGLVVAGWRVAVDDPVTVSIAVQPDDGSPALVLTDAVDRSAGAGASSLSIPLGAAGGRTVVLRLDASAPFALDRLRAGIGSEPIPDAGVARVPAAGSQDRVPVDRLVAEGLRNQAIGVLMHRHGGSRERAGARLRALARATPQTVAAAAGEVVAAAGDHSSPGVPRWPDPTGTP